MLYECRSFEDLSKCRDGRSTYNIELMVVALSTKNGNFTINAIASCELHIYSDLFYDVQRSKEQLTHTCAWYKFPETSHGTVVLYSIDIPDIVEVRSSC